MTVSWEKKEITSLAFLPQRVEQAATLIVDACEAVCDLQANFVDAQFGLCITVHYLSVHSAVFFM